GCNVKQPLANGAVGLRQNPVQRPPSARRRGLTRHEEGRVRARRRTWRVPQPAAAPPRDQLSEMTMFERRDRLYAELGVPPEEPEDPLDARRSRAEREEPEPRERRLDIVPPTLAEIDRRIGERIAAEHEFMIALMAENNVELKREWEVGAVGPPGPSGPPGEQGPPGKLPMVKLWMPETVHYAGDVVAYDGGTFQAKRDTGQTPAHADWVCL